MTMFTMGEIISILKGDKILTIRKNPMKKGKIYILKKDRTSKRYGYIKVIKCYKKPLCQMTMVEAIKGDEKNPQQYIMLQKYKYNKGVGEDDEMYFIEFELSTEEEYNNQK